MNGVKTEEMAALIVIPCKSQGKEEETKTVMVCATLRVKQRARNTHFSFWIRIQSSQQITYQASYGFLKSLRIRTRLIYRVHQGMRKCIVVKSSYLQPFIKYQLAAFIHCALVSSTFKYLVKQKSELEIRNQGGATRDGLNKPWSWKGREGTNSGPRWNPSVSTTQGGTANMETVSGQQNHPKWEGKVFISFNKYLDVIDQQRWDGLGSGELLSWKCTQNARDMISYGNPGFCSNNINIFEGKPECHLTVAIDQTLILFT